MIRHTISKIIIVLTGLCGGWRIKREGNFGGGEALVVKHWKIGGRSEGTGRGGGQWRADTKESCTCIVSLKTNLIPSIPTNSSCNSILGLQHNIFLFYSNETGNRKEWAEDVSYGLVLNRVYVVTEGSHIL